MTSTFSLSSRFPFLAGKVREVLARGEIQLESRSRRNLSRNRCSQNHLISIQIRRCRMCDSLPAPSSRPTLYTNDRQPAFSSERYAVNSPWSFPQSRSSSIRHRTAHRRISNLTPASPSGLRKTHITFLSNDFLPFDQTSPAFRPFQSCSSVHCEIPCDWSESLGGGVVGPNSGADDRAGRSWSVEIIVGR